MIENRVISDKERHRIQETGNPKHVRVKGYL